MSMSSRSAAVLPVLLLAIIALSRIVSIWDGRDPGYDQAMLMSNFPLPPFATYFGPLPYFEQAAPLGSVLELDLVSRIFGNEGLTRFTVIRLIAAALAVGGYFILWELGSPIQSIIADEAYLGSPRMSADIARTMQSRLGLWPAELVADITSRSCAAASRFRTRFD